MRQNYKKVKRLAITGNLTQDTWLNYDDLHGIAWRVIWVKVSASSPRAPVYFVLDHLTNTVSVQIYINNKGTHFWVCLLECVDLKKLSRQHCLSILMKECPPQLLAQFPASGSKFTQWVPTVEQASCGVWEAQLAAFPAFPNVQFWIACSMKKIRTQLWSKWGSVVHYYSTNYFASRASSHCVNMMWALFHG